MASLYPARVNHQCFARRVFLPRRRQRLLSLHEVRMKARTVRMALLLLTIIVSGSRSGTTQSQQPSSAARGQQTPTAAQPQQAPSPTAMTPYEWSNLWLQTATLIVLTITLIVLAVYTGYTRTLANAAVDACWQPPFRLIAAHREQRQIVAPGDASISARVSSE